MRKEKSGHFISCQALTTLHCVRLKKNLWFEPKMFLNEKWFWQEVEPLRQSPHRSIEGFFFLNLELNGRKLPAYVSFLFSPHQH